MGSRPIILDIGTSANVQSLDMERKVWYNGRTVAGAMALAYLLALGSQIGPPKGFYMQKASQGAGVESL
jgi:hypothetical protein